MSLLTHALATEALYLSGEFPRTPAQVSAAIAAQVARHGEDPAYYAGAVAEAYGVQFEDPTGVAAHLRRCREVIAATWPGDDLIAIEVAS